MIFDDILTRVVPYVSGCPDDVAIQHLRQAAREFCERTLLWTVMSEAVLTTPGQALYPLDLDAQQERVQLMDAWVDGQRYAVLDSRLGHAKVRRPCASDRFVYLEGPLDLIVHPTPTQDAKEIIVQMAVKPTLDADEWPDDYAEHVMDISYGAISSLSRLPKKAWSDRQQALDFQAQFESRIQTVGIKVSKGFANRSPRAHSRFL